MPNGPRLRLAASVAESVEQIAGQLRAQGILP
jgi:hypothetical protein